MNGRIQAIRSTVGILSTLLLGALPAGGAAAAEWKIEKIAASYLGTLGGTNSFANDVNDRGDIVGWSDSEPHGVEHAFRLRNGGAIEDLGDILGILRSRAYGINKHGEVVGAILDSEAPNVKHMQAIYWSPDGVLQGIHGKPSNWSQWQWSNSTYLPWSVAHAINNSGGIGGVVCCRVGFSDTEALWWPHAFAVPDGINTFMSTAYDVNESNHVVGQSVNSAYVYRVTDTIYFPQEYLSTEARGINDKNGVVGWYRNSANDKRAFFWDVIAGSWEPIGVLPTGRQSVAHEINDLEFVAGWADVASSQPEVYRDAAFLWHRSFGMVQLPPPASTYGFVTTCEARSLNNRSVGRGVIHVVGACTVLGTTRGVQWDVTVKPKQSIEIGPAPVIGPPRVNP